MKTVRADIGVIQQHIPYGITLLNDAVLNILVFRIARGLAEQNADMLVMGIYGAVFSIFFAVSSIYFGKFADSPHNKKRLMLAGTALLMLCAGMLAVLKVDSPAALAFYGAGGGSAGLVYPPVLAWLNDNRRSDPTRTTKGVGILVLKFCIAWNLGMILGNFTAGQLFAVAVDLPLFIAIGFCLLNVLLIYRMQPSSGTLQKGTGAETVHEESLSSTLPENSRYKAHLFVKLGWIANIGGAFVGSLILHLFPKMAVDTGIPPEQHALILGIMRTAVIGAYFVMYLTTFWHYRLIVMLLLQLVAIVGLLLLFSFQHVVIITCALVCIGSLTGHNYYVGMYYGNAASTVDNCGALNGYHEGTIGLGVGMGSLGGGIVGLFLSPRAPYLFAAAFLVIISLTQFALYIRTVSAAKQSGDAARRELSAVTSEPIGKKSR